MKDRLKEPGAALTTKPRAKTAASGASARRRPASLGPLSAFLGYALRRAQLAVFDDFFQTVADLGLRPAQFGLLVVINQNPGLKQTDASAALGIQTPNFVGLVDELEQRGLAQRQPAANDRRSHALYLTKAGEILLKRVMARQAEHEDRMTARIGKAGREQLLELLDKLATEE
jgi:DNA-binding MarR family transcriptional regulator